MFSIVVFQNLALPPKHPTTMSICDAQNDEQEDEGEEGGAEEVKKCQ